ncbi:MAG TPA: hypothetical protein VN616_09215 [Puia sp.]|nr:hypothetical protein [Puia sp.]
MPSLAKRLISAFVEISNGNVHTPGDPAGAPVSAGRGDPGTHDNTKPHADGSSRSDPDPLADLNPRSDPPDGRFTGHFDKLLGDANIPGPDYYEFARMIAVMQTIPDETARYNAAFAGLQVQGLDRQRLLDTAAEYLRILAADAAQFQSTVDASYTEKVRAREAEAEQKAARIRALSAEILQLQEQIGGLQEDIRAGKEKLAGSATAYEAESKRRLEEIRRDIERINQYIH